MELGLGGGEAENSHTLLYTASSHRIIHSLKAWINEWRTPGPEPKAGQVLQRWMDLLHCTSSINLLDTTTCQTKGLEPQDGFLLLHYCGSMVLKCG